MLELKNITKVYKPKKGVKTIALANVSFTLNDKGMIFLVGKSGSGKSTLLNIIGGLDKPDNGDLILNGKNFKKFKNKDLDSYRNTYIGFIFQEFNILEEYNVYQNIELALNLQKKKITNIEIEKIFKKVGISNLGNRKINELSGGQKQRVAIARAIIKSSDIILADEPTGNLDSVTSNQIFKLLKDISKDKLVIVVSHDMVSAKKYGNRIIELEDGKIANDTGNTFTDISNQSFKLIKSKFRFFKALKFAIGNLKRKQLRLFFTTLLVTFSLILFGMSTVLSEFNIPYTHANTMVNEGTSLVEIHKKILGKNFSTINPVLSFTESETVEVENILGNNITKVSRINEENSYLTISLGHPQLRNENYIAKAYYVLYPISNDFIEMDNFKQINIIGSYPNNAHEILVSKVFADYILENGILIKTINEKEEIIEEEYLPNNYNQILNDKAKISFGSSYLIISGIIDEDLSKYEYLKEVNAEEMNINPDNTYEEFIQKESENMWKFHVKKGFFEITSFTPNSDIDRDLFVFNFLNEEEKVYAQSVMSKITNEMEIYDGKKKIKISNLNDNEVIINTIYLDEISDGEYNNQLKNYIIDLNTEYERKEKEREKLMEDEQKQLENDESYQVKEILEVKRKDISEMVEDFSIDYLNKNNIIGTTINFEINDIYLRTSDIKTNVFENFTIIGCELKGINMYFSDKLLNQYIRGNNETSYIYTNETDIEKLENIFINFPQNNSKYVSQTIYTSDIIEIEKTVKWVEKIAYYISYPFLIFSIILFINFIVVSINSNKKQIGILRAMGAKKKDVFKIFLLEGLLVGIFAFVLSVLGCIIVSEYVNQLISRGLFFNISPIIFKSSTILYLLITIFSVTIISSLFPIYKIARMKPVDAILNK